MTLIEIMIAGLLFSIMVIGISQMMVSGLQQYHYDIRQELAALAANNGYERFRAFTRDHCGTKSFTGNSAGACDTIGKSYTHTYNSGQNSPLPPDLTSSNICSGCVLELSYTCRANNIWEGYSRVVDKNNNDVLASVPPSIMQGPCN